MSLPKLFSQLFVDDCLHQRLLNFDAFPSGGDGGTESGQGPCLLETASISSYLRGLPQKPRHALTRPKIVRFSETSLADVFKRQCALFHPVTAVPRNEFFIQETLVTALTENKRGSSFVICTSSLPSPSCCILL